MKTETIRDEARELAVDWQATTRRVLLALESSPGLPCVGGCIGKPGECFPACRRAMGRLAKAIACRDEEGVELIWREDLAPRKDATSVARGCKW